MKKLFYLLLITVFWSCQKSDQPEIQNMQPGYFTIDGQNPGVKMDTIFNPPLIEVSAGVFRAEFDLYPDRFGKKEFILHAFNNTKIINGVNLSFQGVYAEAEITFAEADTFLSIQSISPTGDSLSNIAGKSSEKLFRDTISVNKKHVNNYFQFNRGDVFNIEDSRWIRFSEIENPLEFGYGNECYLFYHHKSEDENPAHANYNYTILDNHFPLWQGADKKFFAFGWRDIETGKVYHAWAELSISADASCTIHKIVYEVDE